MPIIQDAPEVKRPQEDAIEVDVNSSEPQHRTEIMEYEETFEDTVPSSEITEEREEQPSEEEGEDWEHKYKVLKGKYDKEVPRLHKRLKRLERERVELLSRIELLEKALLAQQEKTSKEETSTMEVDDEDLLKFKEDYPDIYKAITKLLEKKVRQDFENKVNELSNKMTQQQFEAQLTALVPEWRELNTDPDFLDWLQEVEPATGYTRHQLMLFSYQNGDVNGVAKWFKRFLAENNGGNPVMEKSIPAKKNVSPPHRKTSSMREGSKKLFTESEINEFYRKKALGKIPPDRANQIEQEIIQALMENRVIYGK